MPGCRFKETTMRAGLTRCVLLMLLLLVMPTPNTVADEAEEQRELPRRDWTRFEEVDLSQPQWRPDHVIGARVDPPSALDTVLIGHHGDTLVLRWDKVIPSQKRAQDSLRVYYLYTLGDKKATVLLRIESVGGAGHMAVGDDGVIAHSHGYALVDSGNIPPDHDLYRNQTPPSKKGEKSHGTPSRSRTA